MTNYEEYYFKGHQDKADGKPMTIPNTITIHNAFRGYMDGYAGSAFHEPEGVDTND